MVTSEVFPASKSQTLHGTAIGLPISSGWWFAGSIDRHMFQSHGVYMGVLYASRTCFREFFLVQEASGLHKRPGAFGTPFDAHPHHLKTPLPPEKVGDASLKVLAPISQTLKPDTPMDDDMVGRVGSGKSIPRSPRPHASDTQSQTSG